MKRKTGTRKRLFLAEIFTCLLILLYLFSVGGWYVSPEWWWPLGLASIAFAYLYLLLPFLAIAWGKKRRLLALFCLLLMIAGIEPALATFSAGISKDFTISRPANTLRVMQWNCMGLPGSFKRTQEYKQERKKAEIFIRTYQPDIICLQDFNETTGKSLESNISFLKDSLGYRYLLFAEHAHTFRKYGKYLNGTVIASKYAFASTGILSYKGREYPESIAWADIRFGGKFLRVTATHFRSMNMFSQYLFAENDLPYYHKPDSAIVMSRNIFLKIKYYQAEHVEQAVQLRHFLDTSHLPVVLCADLNTVPANYIYRTVKGPLEDGFNGSALGMGATYNYLLPNLRIDYLLNHNKLQIKQWKHFSDGIFDHDHIMADYSWKND